MEQPSTQAHGCSPGYGSGSLPLLSRLRAGPNLCSGTRLLPQSHHVRHLSGLCNMGWCAGTGHDFAGVGRRIVSWCRSHEKKNLSRREAIQLRLRPSCIWALGNTPFGNTPLQRSDRC